MVGVRTSMRWFLAWLWAVTVATPGCHRVVKAYPAKVGGVGIVLKGNAAGQSISRLIAGGPAAGAGLHEGDQIVDIDGEPTTGKSLADVVASLRGLPGTRVIVHVHGTHGEKTVTLTRRELTRSGSSYRVE